MDDDIIRAFKAAMILCEIPDKQIENVLRRANDLYRRGITGKLTAVIDEYYEKTDRGERVTLREMARAAGVNEGSLRQAKFRYDKRYKRPDK